MTALEVLNNAKRQLESQRADLEREEILLKGRIEQIDTTLANLRYAMEHHLDKPE